MSDLGQAQRDQVGSAWIWSLFFDRVTLGNACASMDRVMCRYQPTPRSPCAASTPLSSPRSAGAPRSSSVPWPQTASLLAGELDERARLPVIVIDEAHPMANTDLESLRMLTKAGMDTESHFAMLVIGQPTLRRRLKVGAPAAPDRSPSSCRTSGTWRRMSRVASPTDRALSTWSLRCTRRRLSPAAQRMPRSRSSTNSNRSTVAVTPARSAGSARMVTANGRSRCAVPRSRPTATSPPTPAAASSPVPTPIASWRRRR